MITQKPVFMKVKGGADLMLIFEHKKLKLKAFKLKENSATCVLMRVSHAFPIISTRKSVSSRSS